MTEVRTTSSTGGQKGVKDERYDLIPTEALAQLARHYGVGARKYDDNQWRKGYEFSKSYAALMRHLTQWWGGEDIDEETGSNHMAAVAWHAFTLMTFQQFNPEFDDRFNPPLNLPFMEPAYPIGYPVDPLKWVYVAGPTGIIEPMGVIQPNVVTSGEQGQIVYNNYVSNTVAEECHPGHTPGEGPAWGEWHL